MADGTDDLLAGGGDGPADERTEAVEQAAVAELERLLVADGPLTVEDLAQRFTADSAQLAADLLADRPPADLVERLKALIRHTDAFWRIPDGRLAAVLHHLRRAIFTHRLTAGELERDAVDLTPDLVALALPRSCALSDGTELRTASSADDERAVETGSLLGPAGWLSGFTADDLLAVRYDGEQVDLERIPDAATDEGAGRVVGEALRHTFDGLRADRAPEVHRLVVDTMGVHPSSFAVPVAPLAELLTDAGLRVREAWVGTADRPWPTPPEQARTRRLDELLTGADSCCRRAARRALDAWHSWLEAVVDGQDPQLAPGVAPRLTDDIDHGPVAGVLAEVAALGRPGTGLRRLGDWAAAASAGARRTVAGVEYLRAMGADAAGDAPAAEAHLHSGLEVAPEHPACLGFLAELVQDRGDAQHALTLLHRAGRPPGPESMSELAPFVVDRQVGRNDPCPCGSGRKFKVCCSGRPIQRPLLERCRWLLSKATRHAVRMDPLGVQSLQHFFDLSNSDGEAVALAQDMLLFANGGLVRYLDSRGTLLPDDERSCAEAWVGQPMRLLDIEAVGATGAVEVVEVKSGERLTIVGRTAATSLSVGETVLARALPVGELWLLSGAAVRVPLAGRRRALDLLEDEIRPFQLLQLLVDLQVDAFTS